VNCEAKVSQICFFKSENEWIQILISLSIFQYDNTMTNYRRTFVDGVFMKDKKTRGEAVGVPK
jgi:hypothetical protein